MGEVALRSNDGEGKPVSQKYLRSDKQALCQSDAIAVPALLCQRPCPLSLAPLASSPKGGAVGMSVRPTRDEQSLILSETVVPCYRGQQLRDNIPCQAAVNLCSRALFFVLYWAFSGQRKVARHASGSPFGGAVTEGD